jgi:hypothetical protein
VVDYQQVLFNWVVMQPGITGAVLLGAGLLNGFLGFRMIRFLVTLSCGGVGCLAGTLVASFASLPPGLPMVVGGAVAAMAALAWYEGALAVSAGATFGLLGAYVAVQLGLPETVTWIILGLTGATGLVLGLVSRQTMALLSTTLQGAALMIIGFVGLAHSILPSLAGTFQSWARAQSLTVPVLMTLVTVAAYSVQSAKQQGDICTGK